MKISIVIPTYNHLEDFLKPCVEKVLKYTNWDDKELMIVANGCTDGTKEYLQSLPPEVMWMWFDEPLGYPKAVNEGILATTGEYVVTLDNDSHLLEQPVDTWINMLLAPFEKYGYENVGCSSPATHYFVGLGMACTSGCTMYSSEALESVNIFDETNYGFPGFFTDIDVSLRLTKAGYMAVQVPEGVTRVYTGDLFSGGFPFFHPSTPNTNDKFGKDNDNLVEARKTLYRIHRKPVSIIIPTYNHLEDFLLPCLESIRKYTTLDKNTEVIVVANGCKDREKYEAIPDIKLLWFDEPLGYPKANNEGIQEASGDYFVLLNDDTVLLEQTKDKWIETLLDPFLKDEKVGITGPVKFRWDCGSNKYYSLAFWLVMISKKVVDTIGLLDESFYPGSGEDGDFCIRTVNAGFELVQVPNNDSSSWTEFDGTGIKDFSFPIYHVGSGTFRDVGEKDPGFISRNTEKLVKMYGKKTKISFVIPTYNHLEDCLRPCMDSLFETVDFETPELSIDVIIVANGCTDGTKEYLEQLSKERPYIKYQFHPDPMGFTWSTNRGIEQALPYADYLIMFNNDCIMLPQEKNSLIHSMLEPFKKYPDLGITGPLVLHDRYACHDAVIFFCAMIKKEVFDKIGILLEEYGIGGGEDIDFCVRLVRAGYRQMMVPEGVVMKYDNTNVGPLPIYHKGEGTMDHIPEYGKTIIKKNGFKNMLKYHPDINLNLGAGGIDVPGFHSCDKYDSRSYIILDAEDLSEIPDNKISSILASHLFEHINPYKSVDVLKGWHRVLKPGGKLIMELPNIEVLCREFVTADKATRYGILNCIYGTINTHQSLSDPNYVPSDITSPHIWGWYPEMMYDHLIWAGFTNIKFLPEQIPHSGPTPECNFRVEAEKPL